MKASDFYLQDDSVVTFTESVFVRPQMYTINGTLEEVGAFLQGFYSGVGKNSSEYGMREAETWANFCAWSCYKIGAVGRSWTHLFAEIRRISQDDSHGFAKLAELYIRFRSEGYPSDPTRWTTI